jgi:hypothetical protein
MGCMEMSHSALAIYYKAVQATPQIPLRIFTLAQSGFSSQENIENEVLFDFTGTDEKSSTSPHFSDIFGGCVI